MNELEESQAIRWTFPAGVPPEIHENRIDEGGSPPPPVVPPKPPTGYDDGMESRVAKLEQFAADAGDRLVRIESTLAHVAQDVGQFKWWAAGSAVAIVLAMIGTVLGTGVAIQQMTVSTFQAAGQQQPAQSAQQPIIITVPGAAAQTATPPSRK